MRSGTFVLGLALALALAVPAPASSTAGDAGAEPSVRVQEAEGALAGFPEHDEFIADTTEPQVKVLFSTGKDVRDFKVLALTLEDSDEKITFSAKELYALDKLTPKRPLVVGLTSYGTIPHYGVSYVDENGATRSFAVSESGEDGSLFLMEISTVP